MLSDSTTSLKEINITIDNKAENLKIKLVILPQSQFAGSNVTLSWKSNANALDLAIQITDG